MLQAFLPFLDTQSGPRTQITLLLPEAGDAEVSPAQGVIFSARIDGRVPTGHRADAPHLQYRYQTTEDFLTLPLQLDEGLWTAQLLSAQLRTGFVYKITAGDAATPEYQVRVRARAHVKQFEVKYHHRAYRKLASTTTTFPNEFASRPFIRGPRGTDVVLIVRASRPVRQASAEILTPGARKDLPAHKLPDDPHAFTCRFTLEQQAQLRVAFVSTEGEENIDRDAIDMDVLDDETPRVVLTLPGKDIALPENGVLQLEGLASDDVGLKSLALHMRVIKDKQLLLPRLYRAGKSLQRADGTYPSVIEYKDFVNLDQLKDDKGSISNWPAGTVLEYWLEATDNSDYPNPKGNVGKSLVHKLTLLPALSDAKQLEAQRQQAQKQQQQHEKREDDRVNNEKKQNNKVETDRQAYRNGSIKRRRKRKARRTRSRTRSTKIKRVTARIPTQNRARTNQVRKIPPMAQNKRKMKSRCRPMTPAKTRIKAATRDRAANRRTVAIKAKPRKNLPRASARMAQRNRLPRPRSKARKTRRSPPRAPRTPVRWA